MARLTHSTGRPKHLEKNLNSLDVVDGNNNATSASLEKTTLPTLRYIAEKNRIKLYPFIQQSEYKYKDLLNSSEAESSSIVESSSSSDGDVRSKKILTATEPRLSFRPTSTKEKNSTKPSEVSSIPFFEHMPEELIRKIFFENFINVDEIPTAAKSLMQFASTSKFNRELARQLLNEKGMREFSFEITKSFVPNLLAKLANDINAKFTQSDIDDLVHDYPYLTINSSCQKDTIFTNGGFDAVKKIVTHSGLRAIRIINNLPEKYQEPLEDFRICNNNGLELLDALLSRKSLEPLTVDFIFNNWVRPFDSKLLIKDGTWLLIYNIRDRADACTSVKFDQIDVSRSKDSFFYASSSNLDSGSKEHANYRFNFAKIICHIGLTHSAHTISLAGFLLKDQQSEFIIKAIQEYNCLSLRHLDLSNNDINEAAIKSLSTLLQSDTACITSLNLKRTCMNKDHIDILYAALKKNHSLQLVKIHNTLLPIDHPIRNDNRVKITVVNNY